jgi:hypothetical protein
MSDENNKKDGGEEEVWVNPLLPDGKRPYVVDLQLQHVSQEDDTWSVK